MEQVSQFRYLGSLISADGYCTKEICSKIETVKKVFMEKKKLFTGKMNLELKKRKSKCLVWTLECTTVCSRLSRDVDVNADIQKNSL